MQEGSKKGRGLPFHQTEDKKEFRTKRNSFFM